MANVLKNITELYEEIKVFKVNISKDNYERRKNLNLTHQKLETLDSYKLRLSKLEELTATTDESLEISSEIVSELKIYFKGVKRVIEDTYNILESRLQIESNMENFDLKTAGSLLPCMDGSEETTKQLIDSIILYAEFLKPEHKKYLITYVLKTRLTQNAKIRLSTSYDTVEALVKDIRDSFVSKKSATTISNQLHQAKQLNKSINEFGKEIEQLVTDLTYAQAGDDENLLKSLQPVNEKIAINSFCNGVRNHELRTILRARHCTTLKDAISTAIDEELNKPSSSNVMYFNTRTRVNNRGYRGHRNRQTHNHGNTFQNTKFSSANSNSHYRNPNQNVNYTRYNNNRKQTFHRGSNRGNRVYRGSGNRGNAFCVQPAETSLNEENKFFRE